MAKKLPKRKAKHIKKALKQTMFTCRVDAKLLEQANAVRDRPWHELIEAGFREMIALGDSMKKLKALGSTDK